MDDGKCVKVGCPPVNNPWWAFSAADLSPESGDEPDSLTARVNTKPDWPKKMLTEWVTSPGPYDHNMCERNCIPTVDAL